MMQLGCDGVFVGSGICESNLIQTYKAYAYVSPLWRPSQASTSHRTGRYTLQQPRRFG